MKNGVLHQKSQWIVERVKIKQPYFTENSYLDQIYNKMLDECFKVGYLRGKLEDLGYIIQFEKE